MTGWLSDLFLLGWGALYWNTRKTWHILRGRRSRCPCHVTSDSGRAYETGCEAVTHLKSPARFRAVCPLLHQRADGAWVCSVGAEKVRPFWGRATLLLAGGSLSAYLLAALLGFLLLSALGYRVSYRQTAWPPAWRELRVVQAERYLEKARDARAAGRPAEALLALSNAYDLNPADYGTGLLLAQLWQAGQPALSDSVFARLYRDHAGKREQTAQAWYRSLLARGDFAAVIPLARDRLVSSENPAHAPAWTQAFLFAARRLEGFSPDARLLENPSLSPTTRSLLLLENSLRTQPAAQRVQTLVGALSAERDAFALNHLLRRLLEEKRADLVLAQTLRPDLPLGDREKVRLRLDALADLGRTTELSALVRQILALPAHPAIWELLSSHLIARPNRALLRAVADKHRSAPLPADEAGYAQFLGWFAACAINGDAELLDEAARLLTAAAARDSRALEFARKTLLAPPESFRLETVLPLLQPLPLEPTYALYDRYVPPLPPPN